jgi:hypothetical protein
LNTLSLCSSLNVRDQASHTYKATHNIIVLYISCPQVADGGTASNMDGSCDYIE